MVEVDLRTLDGRRLRVDAALEDTVRDLKKKIKTMPGIPPRFRLTLKAMTRSIFHYNLPSWPEDRCH